MFVDRVYTTDNHVELFCITCGARKFHHNSNEREALWLIQSETKRMQALIFQ
jgi:hypothetical protein